MTSAAGVRPTPAPQSHPSPSARDRVCPACGHAGPVATVHVPDHEYDVAWDAVYATCASCSTSFQEPMPDEASLSSFYPADYHSVGRTGLLTRIRYDMRVRRLRPLVTGDGAILDHGCGDGSFLVHAAATFAGRKLVGYEISDRPEVRRIAGGAVTIIRGSSADLLAELPPCRVITMNHVIEHLPKPLETLRSLRERLVAGGTLEGQTPAAASLEHKVFGVRWSGYHAPRHTVVFSRQGLKRCLERAGFVDVSIRAAFNPAGIAVSLASLGQAPDSSGRIVRAGPSWLLSLGMASLLAPIDVLSGAPGIVDFRAVTGPR